MEQKERFHGSDLEKVESVYGIKKEDIVCFSANVNPLGVSYRLREELPRHIDAIMSYPDREYTALRKCIAAYTHTTPEHIVVGNGSTELISLAMQMLHPMRACIIGPTYSEYEHEISLLGGHIDYFPLKESDQFLLDLKALRRSLTSDIDLLVICNPNNPTSSLISRQTMCEILDTCKEQDVFVMVDETYIEFAEHTEAATSIPLTAAYNNLIILRGISKFFAAPGLRLGYAVCGNHRLLNAMNKRKNPWTINSLATVAGEIMFRDKEYIRDTYQLIDRERRRICSVLDSCDFVKYYPPHANFILIKILSDRVTAGDLFDAAIRRGLMIRDCSDFPFLDSHYIRFCFMRPEDNDRLIQVLRETLCRSC